MACHHFSGDECLHGTSPLAGTELCGVVEAMPEPEVMVFSHCCFLSRFTSLFLSIQFSAARL